MLNCQNGTYLAHVHLLRLIQPLQSPTASIAGIPSNFCSCSAMRQKISFSRSEFMHPASQPQQRDKSRAVHGFDHRFPSLLQIADRKAIDVGPVIGCPADPAPGLECCSRIKEAELAHSVSPDEIPNERTGDVVGPLACRQSDADSEKIRSCDLVEAWQIYVSAIVGTHFTPYESIYVFPKVRISNVGSDLILHVGCEAFGKHTIAIRKVDVGQLVRDVRLNRHHPICGKFHSAGIAFPQIDEGHREVEFRRNEDAQPRKAGWRRPVLLCVPAFHVPYFSAEFILESLLLRGRYALAVEIPTRNASRAVVRCCRGPRQMGSTENGENRNEPE